MGLRVLATALVAGAVLAGCGQATDSGAGANTAGTGGSSGAKGSAPHPGGSGADMVQGASGKGTAEPGGRSAAVAPGSGLNGGLGASNGTAVLGGPPRAAEGTTNRTQQGSMQGR